MSHLPLECWNFQLLILLFKQGRRPKVRLMSIFIFDIFLMFFFANVFIFFRSLYVYISILFLFSVLYILVSFIFLNNIILFTIFTLFYKGLCNNEDYITMNEVNIVFMVNLEVLESFLTIFEQKIFSKNFVEIFFLSPYISITF